MVAAARAHRNTGLEPERLGGIAPQRAHHAQRWSDLGQGSSPVAPVIDGSEDGVAVLAPADVEIRGARRVAELAHEVASQPEIQIVVRQAHPHGSRVRVRLVCGEPRDLRRRITRKDLVAREFKYAARAAELQRQLRGFARGRRVVPQLRGPHRSIASVQAHESMLLPGHGDAADLEAPVAHRVAHGDAERVDPPRGFLLARAVVAFDQLMRRATDRDDRASLRIAEHDLGRLSAAIDAEEDAPHSLAATAPRSSAAREATRLCRRSTRRRGR